MSSNQPSPDHIEGRRVTVLKSRLEQLQPEERLDPSALMIGIGNMGRCFLWRDTGRDLGRILPTRVKGMSLPS